MNGAGIKARLKHAPRQIFSSLADQADEGLKHNNLRSVFRAIRSLSTSPTHARTSSNGSVPIKNSNGQPCRSTKETLECWRSHYGNVLNHAPGTMCSDLDSAAKSTTPDLTIPVDATSTEEVVAAIRKLKNARAPGPDGIQHAIK